VTAPASSCHSAVAHTAVPANRRTIAMLMNFHIVALQPLIALLAGILILVMPRLLNYIVALYLIIIGLTGLWPHLLR
jgi:hypothetical protein